MRLRAFCVVAGAACLASLVLDHASADTIGPLNTVGTTTGISINGNDPFQRSEAAWLIGGSDSPMQFGYSPSAGYWLKNLGTAGSVDPGDEVNLIEYVENTGSVPWSTWTENLRTSGWQFDKAPGDTDDTWYSVDGGVTQIQGTVSPDGSTITYSFSSPITSGEQIVLHAEPKWEGPGEYNGTIQVAEATVPEPSTLGLLAAAGVGLLGCFWPSRGLIPLGQNCELAKPCRQADRASHCAWRHVDRKHEPSLLEHGVVIATAGRPRRLGQGDPHAGKPLPVAGQ